MSNLHIRHLGPHAPVPRPHIQRPNLIFLLINQSTLTPHPSNTHTFSAGYFEWSGKLFGSPPTPATISFGRNCLLLLTENSKIAEFPFPTAAEALIARGFGLRPVSGSHFFARPSHGIGHKHPIRSSTPNPPPPLPLLIQRWPASSPATTSPDLPEYEEPPLPDFLSAVFFLLVAAWVDPGRNALQSAEQRC